MVILEAVLSKQDLPSFSPYKSHVLWVTRLLSSFCSLEGRNIQDVSENCLKMYEICLCVPCQFSTSNPCLCQRLLPRRGSEGWKGPSGCPGCKWQQPSACLSQPEFTVSALGVCCFQTKSLNQKSLNLLHSLNQRRPAKSDTQLRVRTCFSVPFPNVSLCPVKFSLSQHFERKGQAGNIGWLVTFFFFFCCWLQLMLTSFCPCGMWHVKSHTYSGEQWKLLPYPFRLCLF